MNEKLIDKPIEEQVSYLENQIEQILSLARDKEGVNHAINRVLGAGMYVESGQSVFLKAAETLAKFGGDTIKATEPEVSSRLCEFGRITFEDVGAEAADELCRRRNVSPNVLKNKDDFSAYEHFRGGHGDKESVAKWMLGK
ncbi:hypothetical protein KKD37_03145 [Patescibacteria group bacterium]|nr:hypothetical protein [Patescibacteria group bacterium]